MCWRTTPNCPIGSFLDGMNQLQAEQVRQKVTSKEDDSIWTDICLIGWRNVTHVQDKHRCVGGFHYGEVEYLQLWETVWTTIAG
mmetsp:Transcript_15444/g.22807  ORF Transcript_15444/g.22807 Transcript_15444/m.22807 type:complete len:84 (+) Transcript_15444:133-384(+)